MWPSPRYSRRIDWACQSTRCGASGHGRGRRGPRQGSPSTRRAGLLGQRARQLGRPAHLVRLDKTSSPSRRRKAAVDRAKAGRHQRLGRRDLPGRGMAACTSSGLKLKKVETTTSAVTAPMGAAREAK
jgi:hypothetical protein